MGPSVKFISAIKDAIFNNKKWGTIFFRKKIILGGEGSEGEMVKNHTPPPPPFVKLFRKIDFFLNDGFPNCYNHNLHLHPICQRFYLIMMAMINISLTNCQKKYSCNHN